MSRDDRLKQTAKDTVGAAIEAAVPGAGKALQAWRAIGTVIDDRRRRRLDGYLQEVADRIAPEAATQAELEGLLEREPDLQDLVEDVVVEIAKARPAKEAYGPLAELTVQHRRDGRPATPAYRGLARYLCELTSAEIEAARLLYGRLDEALKVAKPGVAGVRLTRVGEKVGATRTSSRVDGTELVGTFNVGAETAKRLLGLITSCGLDAADDSSSAKAYVPGRQDVLVSLEVAARLVSIFRVSPATP